MGKLIRVVSVILIAAMLYLIFQAVGIMALLKKQQKVITPTEFVE